MKHTVGKNTLLEKNITDQADEILNQRMQLKKFAGEINSLKNTIVRLNDFENKIRIMANIEQTNKQENLFGIGGSPPEDLDPRIDISKKQTALIREMHDQVNQISQAGVKQEKRFDSLLMFLEDQKTLLASTPAIRPSDGWVTSRFGYRISPFTGRREFHKGLDIANRKGSPIIATADGVVSFVGEKGALGNVVIIDHGHGLRTRYAHLDKALKNRNDKVKRGDVIAQIGNSGRTTGTHLHYEVHLNGVQVNPSKYILN
ncbi:MAG: M23 family metallopeptidase [Desulfobacteraceae bacterium]|nr:M23 family metallopeptidase [Desulfobacteraceae bacterium]